MKFIDMLKSTIEFDGELVTDRLESEYGFVWSSKQIEITKFGFERYREIYESECKLYADEKGAVITLLNEKITEEIFDEFMANSAGYIETSFFDKCFKVKP